MTFTVRSRGRRFEGYASAVVDGQRATRQRSGFRTYEDAEAWAARQEAELLGGTPATSRTPATWGELLDWGWEHHYRRVRSLKAARSIIEDARTRIGAGTPLLAISRATLRDYVTKLRRAGQSESTVARKLTVVRKLLKDAALEGWIPAAPEPPTVQAAGDGRIRWLTDDEEARMIAELERAGREDYARLVTFLVDTGLRLGEALGLTWRHVTNSGVTVERTKNDTTRVVPLTARAAGILASLETRGGPFANLTEHTFHRVWNAAKTAMGLQEDEAFVPHALRHTFASRLVQRGVSLQVVQQLLGHKRIEMTLVYAHLAQDNLRAAVDVLNRG